MTYYVNAPMSWPEGSTQVQQVYLDQEKVPFHVAIDAFYSESAHLADIILPDATFLEKWDLDSRNSYELIPYVGLRQPVVKPLGESKDIRDILRELAQHIGGGMEKYFNYQSAEDYVRTWAENIPGGLEALQEKGVYWNPGIEPNYEPYKRRLSHEDLQETHVDAESGIIRNKNEQVVGIMIDGVAFQGFQTPTRKFQIFNPTIEDLNKKHGTMYHSLPTYQKIHDHKALGVNQFILTSFKWNVHTQSRTMNQKWLAEIVHDNPMWINTKTANELGIANGDLIEISNERASLQVRAHVTEGIHPKTVAISASLGHTMYGPIASGFHHGKTVEKEGMDLMLQDEDVKQNKWWKETGYNPNPLIPSLADPVGGGQSWNDTIVTIRTIKDNKSHVGTN
jgi:thiosulfate reductase/polysulfide reductase chain A